MTSSGGGAGGGSGLQITPSSLTICVGGSAASFTLTYNGSDVTTAATWSTSNPIYFSVSDGVVTPGSCPSSLCGASILYNYQGQNGSAVVNEYPSNSDCVGGGGGGGGGGGLTVSPQNIPLQVGQSGQFTATYNGTDVTDAATWSSGNTKDATISAAGTVKAVSCGAWGGDCLVSIHASYKGNSGSATVDISSSGGNGNSSSSGNGSCPGGNGCPPTPSCTFTGDPTTVTVGQSSDLTYSCQNVTACGITGTDNSSHTITVGSSDSVSGVWTVAPGMDTSYNLICYGEEGAIGSNTAYDSVTTIQITVNNNPGLHETNP